MVQNLRGFLSYGTLGEVVRLQKNQGSSTGGCLLRID